MGRRALLVLLTFTAAVAISLGMQDGDANAKIDADKLYNEANSLLKSGNYAGAVEKYTQAIKLFKDDFKYYYQRGLALKNNKQLDDAIASFNEALRLKPDLTIGHNAAGSVFLLLRQFDNAIPSFTEALKYDKGLSQAKLGLVEAYAGKSQELLNAGKYDEALSVLIQTSVEYPENSKIHLILASAYNRTDEPKDAVEAALSAIKFKNKGGKGAEYFELGLAYKKLGQKDKAREAFGEARKDAAYARNAQYELDGLK